MRIEQIRASAFGRFKNFEVSLHPGLNLILGPNESGKSTLVEAVFGVLFGYRSDRDRFKPMSGPDDFQAGLSIEADGRLLDVTRDFTSNRVLAVERAEGGREKVLINEKLSPSGRASDAVPYLGLLNGLLGFSDPDLFRAMVLIGQDELLRSWEDGAQLIRALLAGSAARGSDDVLQALEDQYYGLTRLDPEGRKRMKKSRLIEQINDDLRSREEMIEGARAAEERRGRIEEKLGEAREELVRARAALAEQAGIVEHGEALLRARGRLADLERRHDEIYRDRMQYAEAQQQLAGIEESLKGLADVSGLTSRDFESAGRLKVNREAMERSREALDLARAESDQIRPPSPGLPAVLSAAALAAAAAAAALVAGPSRWAAIFTAAVIAAALWIYYGRKRSNANARREQVLSRLSLAEADLDRASSEYREGLAGLPEALRVSIDNINEISLRLGSARDLLLKREGILSFLRSRPATDQIDSALAKLNREIASLKSEEESILQTLPGLAGLEAAGLKRAAALRDQALERIDRLQEELISLERESAAASVGSVDLEAASEEIAALEERLQRASKRRDALLLAQEILREAVEEFRQESVGRVGDQIATIFSRCTGDRYDGVVMDERFSPLPTLSGVGPMSPGRLSAGTRDQLYLSARVAILRHLAGPGRLPLILDDPLSHSDDERKRALMDLLVELSGEHQIVLLSHDPSLAKLAGSACHVVRLERIEA